MGRGHALLVFLRQQDAERKRELQAALSDWSDLVDLYAIRRHEPEGADGQTLYDPDGTLAARYGIADEGLVLIRPDGYISFRSRPIAEGPLQDYLRAHFSVLHA